MRFLALLATFSLVLGAQEASAEIRSKAFEFPIHFTTAP